MAPSKADFHAKQGWFGLREQELVRVRIFSPKGYYPRGRICLPSGFYHAEESLGILVTRGHSWHHYIENCGFDEFESPFPQESIFMGSMILCEKPDEPSIAFYPAQEPAFLLNPDTVDLADPFSQDSIIDLMRDTARWPVNPVFSGGYKTYFSRQLDLFDANSIELSRLDKTWSLISPCNFVLLRGLVALMKSDMLSRHRQFGAEALMNLYIALECSFQLVIEHLRKDGHVNPTAATAAKWMHDTFDQHFNWEEPDPTYKYFQEFYEGRVVMFHPRSRFGDHPFAPNFWDDVIHLRRALPGTFAYLLHGEHSAAFLEAVAEFQSSESAP